MRIPTGNFGNVVAEPQRQVMARDSGAVGDALGNVGRALGGAVQDMQQVELQRQRAQAGLGLATATNKSHDLADEIGRDVTDGKLPAAQAVPEFRRRMGELTGEITKDFTVDQRTVIDEHLTKSNGQLERHLNGVAIARTQSETGATLLGMSEQFQRAAMRDLPGAIKQWDSAVDTMGPAAGWDPAKIASAKQSFKESASYNFADATLEGAAQTGNADLVRAAREKLQGPDGEVLDPARRTALITKAYGYEQGIAAAAVRDAERAKREQEARENKARDALKDAQGLVLNGRYMSTDYISELSALTAGTSAAPAVQELVRSQAAVAGFASLPLSQQTALIERRRAAGSTPGAGVSPDQEKITDNMERIMEAGKKAYSENPWTAAQERGVIPRAPAAPMNDIPTAMAVLAERMKQIGTVEAAAEQKVSPLQPQEAETIGRLVQALPPDQQSSALASLGKMIGDGDRLAALARQIDAKDKVLGTMMMYATSKTSEGRYTSELIRRGVTAIKDGAVKVDSFKVTGWRADIAKTIGDAYQDQEVRERMIDAAYWIKAGLTADGTVKDGIENAVKLATGGIVERGGSKVPLPYGMNESTFEKRLSSIKPADLSAQAPDGKVFVGRTAVPLEQFVNSLPDAALVNAGQGRYNIRAGMGLVTNSQGKRITIEVRNGN